MLGPMVLPRLGFDLKPGSFTASNGHIEAQGWGVNLRPWGCPVTALLLESFGTEWLPLRARISPESKLPPRAMYQSVVQPRL